MSSALATSFELFTSLRYDPRLRDVSWNNWLDNPPSPFLLLPYHYDRLIQAAQQFVWPVAIQALGDKTQGVDLLRALCQECVDRRNDSEQPLRIRVTLSQGGEVKAQAFPTASLPHDLLYPSTFNPDSVAAFQFPSRQLKVYMDVESTPQSMYTSYKTTTRVHYDRARARVGIAAGVPEEVILYNPEGQVMEGSVRNVAFWRDGRWVTPGLDSGCLAGTIRRWLLEQGRVVEGRIDRTEVRVGEWVLLCNGVEGCLLGIVSVRYW